MKKCAICNKKHSNKASLFCSKRCADIDLHHWLEGRYAIPTQEFGGRKKADDDDKDN